MQNKKFQNPFENFNENISQMWDANKMQEQAAKNMEAMSAVNQIVVDGVQILARRTSEELQRSAQRSMECVRESARSNSLEEAQKIQTQFASEMMKNYLGNAKEVTEIASRAAMELADVCSKSLSDNASQWAKAANKATSNSNKK